MRDKQMATIRQRNVIHEGDQVEFYGPGFRHFETVIEDLHDANGNKIDRAPNRWSYWLSICLLV